MKKNFKMVGNDETKVRIQVQIESPKYVLTRYEVQARVARLQNAIHAVLREFGYDVGQIKLISSKARRT